MNKDYFATIDNSIDSEYHTQCNNRVVPYASCNTTSLINFCETNNIEFKMPQEEIDKGTQAEDYLTNFLLGKESMEKMKELAPWAVTAKIPPNQVWVMMEWGLNRICQRRVCELSFNSDVNRLIRTIVIDRKAVVVGGKFTSSGHFICVVGCKYMIGEQGDYIPSLFNFVEIIVDDPYGNPLLDYKDHRGNSVHLPMDFFLDKVREFRISGKVWGFYPV